MGEMLYCGCLPLHYSDGQELRLIQHARLYIMIYTYMSQCADSEAASFTKGDLLGWWGT